MTPAEAERLVRGFEYAVGVYPTFDPVYATARAALLAAMEPVGGGVRGDSQFRYSVCEIAIELQAR